MQLCDEIGLLLYLKNVPAEHTTFQYDPENLETKEANKSSVLYVKLILITSYLDSFLKK